MNGTRIAERCAEIICLMDDLKAVDDRLSNEDHAELRKACEIIGRIWRKLEPGDADEEGGAE